MALRSKPWAEPIAIHSLDMRHVLIFTVLPYYLLHPSLRPLASMLDDGIPMAAATAALNLTTNQASGQWTRIRHAYQKRWGFSSDLGLDHGLPILRD